MADDLRQGFTFDGMEAGTGSCPAMVRFRGRVRGQELLVLVEGNVAKTPDGRLDWLSAGGEAVLDKLGGILSRLGAGPIEHEEMGSGSLAFA